jgi:hypothetical protein
MILSMVQVAGHRCSPVPGVVLAAEVQVAAEPGEQRDDGRRAALVVDVVAQADAQDGEDELPSQAAAWTLCSWPYPPFLAGITPLDGSVALTRRAARPDRESQYRPGPAVGRQQRRLAGRVPIWSRRGPSRRRGPS